MTEKLLIVADLGRLKAFRLQESREFSHPRLTLIEDWETNVTQHLTEEVTDQAGQFRKRVPRAEGASALSDGEQHNLDLERRRRSLKMLAQHMCKLLDREKDAKCYFAADNRINKPLLCELGSEYRRKIDKNVEANPTRLNLPDVLKHFCE